MAAKKASRAKSRKTVTRAKPTRKSSVRSTRKAPQAKGPANPVSGPIEIW